MKAVALAVVVFKLLIEMQSVIRNWSNRTLSNRKGIDVSITYLFPHRPVAPSGLFLLLLGRLGMMTFSKSPNSVRLVVMLQVFVFVPCFPGL